MPFDGVNSIGNEAVRKMDEVINLLSTPDKWHKGDLLSPDRQRYCIRGAVRLVMLNNTGDYGLLEMPILSALQQLYGKQFRRIQDIERWNDHPNTSHEQVLAVLHRARENLSLSDMAIADYAPATQAKPRRLHGALSWLGF